MSLVITVEYVHTRGIFRNFPLVRTGTKAYRGVGGGSKLTITQDYVEEILGDLPANHTRLLEPLS